MTHIILKFSKTLIPTNPFYRFILVGVLNTIVGLGVTFLFLHGCQTNYWVATFLGNGIGGCVSYYLNRTFTFQSKRSIKSSSWQFLLVVLCCYFFSYGASGQLMTYLPYFSETLKQNMTVILGAGLYTITNYVGQKKIVFRVKE